jgi:hypothetical protein
VAGVPHGELTVVLDDVRSGVPGARERQAEAVYPELRRLARAWLLGQLRGEDP